jgi:Arc/MetJ family transcription regulator
MRTTVTLDDELIAKAQQLSGIKERTAVLHEALRALIAREAQRRLARLGGTEPRVKPIPRRRSPKG